MKTQTIIQSIIVTFLLASCVGQDYIRKTEIKNNEVNDIWIQFQKHHKDDACNKIEGTYGNTHYCFYDSTNAIDLKEFKYLSKDNEYFAYMRIDLYKELGYDNNKDNISRQNERDERRNVLEAAKKDLVCIIKWPVLQCITGFTFQTSSKQIDNKFTDYRFLMYHNNQIFRDSSGYVVFY